MAGEKEICILHGEISREIAGQNKDIGKVSERLGRVEENTKCVPDILETLKAIALQRAHSTGFVAGISIVVSGIISLIGVGASIWFSRGGH